MKLYIINSLQQAPSIWGLDADKGAGDNFDVSKERGHPNNDNLITFVKTVSLKTLAKHKGDGYGDHQYEVESSPEPSIA